MCCLMCSCFGLITLSANYFWILEIIILIIVINLLIPDPILMLVEEDDHPNPSLFLLGMSHHEMNHQSISRWLTSRGCCTLRWTAVPGCISPTITWLRMPSPVGRLLLIISALVVVIVFMYNYWWNCENNNNNDLWLYTYRFCFVLLSKIIWITCT